MYASKAPGTNSDIEWETIRVRQTVDGYTAREVAAYRRSDPRTEMTLRMAGVTLMLSATIAWKLAPVALPGRNEFLQALGAMLILTAGVGCFFIARRGFRREIRLDLTAKRLVVARLSMNDRRQSVFSLALDEIDSLFVRRLDAGEAQASLVMRIAGDEYCLLRGPDIEMTALHRKLARDIGAVLSAAVQPRGQSHIAPSKASGKIVPRRVRPTRDSRMLVTAGN